MTKSILGIIGGSGIYDLPGLEDLHEESVTTPWGEPSDALRFGKVGATEVVFLPRHGRGHRLSPSDINYRANIDALKRAGVTDLVSLSACGSFKAELPSRHLRRWSISSSTAPSAGNPRSSAMAASRMSRWRIRWRRGCASTSPPPPTPKASPIVRGGTYVCMEGPQFSSLAESLAYQGRRLFDVIGMTNMPEAKLAREAEICYATVAMVTDFDCWHPDHDAVDVAGLITMLAGQCREGRAAGGAARCEISPPSTSPVPSAPTGRSIRRSSPRARRATPS